MKKLALLLVIFVACSKKDSQAFDQGKIEETIRIFASETLKSVDDTMIIDSLSVTDVDSFSTLDDLRFRINNLNDSLMLVIEMENLNTKITGLENDIQLLSGSLTEREKLTATSKINEQNENRVNIKAELDRIDSLLLLASSGTVDSTNFVYYVANIRICVTDNTMVQKCSNGFVRLTNNYRIIPTRFW